MIALLVLSLVAAATNDGPAVSEHTVEIRDAAIAMADCFKREAAGLDDGMSGADVIATAVVGGCATQVGGLESVLKKQAIDSAKNSSGLKPREQNELALTLLNDVSSRTKEIANKGALRAVLLHRSKKTNAAHP